MDRFGAEIGRPIVFAFVCLLIALSAGCVSQGTYDETLASNQELSSQLASALDEASSLGENLESLEAIHGETLSQLRGLRSDLAEATAAIDQLEETTDGLQTTLATTESELSGLRSEYRTLVSVHEALAGEHRELESVAGELEVAVAQVEALREEEGALRAAIEDLEAQRAPLILDVRTGAFACTGSMEPKITCLDSATWLKNFTPDDIVVGTVISFVPTEECNLTVTPGRRVAHRVIAVKQVDGTHHYWPRGDANRSDDGCWVPEYNVDSYLVQLHEDTHPENGDLRDWVNTLSAAYNAALDLLYAREDAAGESSEEYLAKEAEYESYVDEHCPGNACPAQYYEAAMALYDEVQSLSDALSQAHDSYEAAWDAFSVARDAYDEALDAAMGQ